MKKKAVRRFLTMMFTLFAVSASAQSGPAIKLDISKSSWSIIGSQNGEIIGTATLENSDVFDHIEAEIRCQEDPDQYITFANINRNGGNLACYSWEGGWYDLNKGYHYTLYVKGFDVPYYGVKPIATATYDIVGTGKEARKYSALTIVGISLTEDKILYHGYNVNGTTFDITFSEPISQVKSWIAMGFDGSIILDAKKKSEDGTVWTIIMTEDILALEGAVNVMVQAWDANSVMAKGENGDHAFAFNINLHPEPTGISHAKLSANGDAAVYNLQGRKVETLTSGQLYIRKGKKFVMR